MAIRDGFDLEEYEARTRTGPCFICELLKGNPDYHHIVYEDDAHLAFLNKYPTQAGYVLVCPKSHKEDLTSELTTGEYLSLQTLAHKVAKVLQTIFDAERCYILSLGSAQGNAHIHFHVVPLPKGTPYKDQQYHALMAENGVLAFSNDEFAEMATKIRTAMTEQFTK